MAKIKRKRYTDKEKQKIVNFVNEHNAQNGRGGQAAASEKYKVSVLSIGKWLKDGSPASKKTTAGKTKVATKPKSLTATLNRMTAIQEKIDALNAEFEVLKKQL